MVNKKVQTVAAIIEINGKVLLMKRANTHVFEDFWALPGGKIDDGESPEKTIIREVKEEVNISFKPKNFFGRYKENFPQYDWDADSFVFTGTFSGDVKGNEESSKIDWFSLNEVKDMKLAFHHKKIIEDYFKSRK